MGNCTALNASAIIVEHTVRVALLGARNSDELQRRGRTLQGNRKRAKSSIWRTSYGTLRRLAAYLRMVCASLKLNPEGRQIRR